MNDEPTPGGADKISVADEAVPEALGESGAGSDAGQHPAADQAADATADQGAAAEPAEDASRQAQQEQAQQHADGSDGTASDADADGDAMAAQGLSEVVHERLEEERVQLVLEAALQAANEPLTVQRCLKLFRRGELPVSESETQRELIRRLLEGLMDHFEDRGVELKRVASGYRLQVRQDLSPWVSRLWEEKPPRYSRALMETLSLIAYRQPVTRGDIELVRGVAVSSNIIRTLQERGWIREVGHREVPGRPALYGTTREFLDYFNLKTLSELPPLEEIRALIEPVVVPEPEVEAAAMSLTDAEDQEAPMPVEDADALQTLSESESDSDSEKESESETEHASDADEDIVGVPESASPVAAEATTEADETLLQRDVDTVAEQRDGSDADDGAATVSDDDAQRDS